MRLLVAKKRPSRRPFAVAPLRPKLSFDRATRSSSTPNNVGSSLQSAQHRSPAPTASHSSSICATATRRRSSSLITLRPSPSCASCLRPLVADLRSTVLSLLVAKKRPLDALLHLHPCDQSCRLTGPLVKFNTEQRWQQSAISTAPIAGTNSFTLELHLHRRSTSSIVVSHHSPSFTFLCASCLRPRVAECLVAPLDEALCCLRRKKGRASDSLDPDRSTLQPVNAPTIKHPCVELVCKKTSLARSRHRHLQDFCKTCSLNLRVNRYDQRRRAANRLTKFASPPSTVTDASHSPRLALLCFKSLALTLSR